MKVARLENDRPVTNARKIDAGPVVFPSLALGPSFSSAVFSIAPLQRYGGSRTERRGDIHLIVSSS